MLKNTLWLLTLAIFIRPPFCPAAEAPHELAGFVLGGEMAAHMQNIKPDTVLPVRHLESLKEVETKDIWDILRDISHLRVTSANIRCRFSPSI